MKSKELLHKKITVLVNEYGIIGNGIATATASINKEINQGE